MVDESSLEVRKSNLFRVLVSRIISSPLLWCGLLTTGFYLGLRALTIAEFIPFPRTLFNRYFCSHPLEYATTTLFFLGIATLGVKSVRLLRERAVMNKGLLGDPNALLQTGVNERASKIERALTSCPAKHVRTALGQRIQDVCDFVRGREPDGVEEQLKYLGELAAEKLHRSYGLVRTVTWAIPIIGFLGTVIGITVAIANVSGDQLSSSLDDVIGGLAIAFDTTALALTLTIILVFILFVVERAEQQVLEQVEGFAMKQLRPLFPSSMNRTSPLMEAESRAADQLIKNAETMINRQTVHWQECLETLRESWVQTLAQQQSSLSDALNQGTSSTLANHSAQLEDLRAELVGGYEAVTNQLSKNLYQSQQTQQELLASMSEQVHGWQDDLSRATTAINEQLKELQRQGEVLLKITAQEEQLVKVQERLSDNLTAVHTAEAFEETLLSLNAAVHLLTARTKPKAA